MNAGDTQKSSICKKMDIGKTEIYNLVRGLYLGFLNREPDETGMQYWIAAIEAGADIDAAILGFVSSPEYRRRLTTTQHIDNIKSAVATFARSYLAELPMIIVDIGAQNLQDEDHVYAAIEKFEIPKKIIGFEPLDDRRSDRHASENSDDINLLGTFIGDGRTHTFHVNNPDSTSSLLALNERVIKEFIGLSGLTTERTETVSTETLDNSLSLYPVIDFLKLDIQGFELDVLCNSVEILKRTQVVHCEVSFIEIYREQPFFSEIEIFMRGIGFHFIDFSALCRYPYHNMSNIKADDRLGWADAIFFRDKDFTAMSERNLFVQSLIALFIYNKPTLSAFLATSCPPPVAALFGSPS